MARAAHDGEMYLGGLTELSSEAAALLGMRPGRYLPHAFLDDAADDGCWLRLHGIRKLTSATAEALGHARRPLALDRVVELDAEAVRRLVATPGDLSLGGVTELDDDVAEALAGHIGSLWLDGVLHLSPAAADSLARHVGPVSLENATAISSPALIRRALELREPNGPVVLHRFAELPVEIARVIVEGEPVWIGLDGLADLPEELAEVLCRHRGELSLNGVRSLTPRVAGLLADREGETWLAGLLTVDPESLDRLRSRSTIHLPLALQ
jgi:hypothetical protein